MRIKIIYRHIYVRQGDRPSTTFDIQKETQERRADATCLAVAVLFSTSSSSPPLPRPHPHVVVVQQQRPFGWQNSHSFFFIKKALNNKCIISATTKFGPMPNLKQRACLFWDLMNDKYRDCFWDLKNSRQQTCEAFLRKFAKDGPIFGEHLTRKKSSSALQ